MAFREFGCLTLGKNKIPFSSETPASFPRCFRSTLSQHDRALVEIRSHRLSLLNLDLFCLTVKYPKSENVMQFSIHFPVNVSHISDYTTEIHYLL